MNTTILRPRRSADQHRVVGLKYSDAMGLSKRAGAVVARDVPPDSLAAGTPVKVIRDLR